MREAEDDLGKVSSHFVASGYADFLTTKTNLFIGQQTNIILVLSCNKISGKSQKNMKIHKLNLKGHEKRV